MTFFDCSDSSQLLSGLRAARVALARRELAVIPTDTVYGVAADAFSPQAVAKLLAAKGRERTSPPPVLIPNVDALHALAATVPEGILEIARNFWPGALTIILPAQPSLTWDLGETAGTVALRIPQHPIALELLQDTGPLAVSSANLSGQPAAESAAQALEMLGNSVEVYLDDPATRSVDDAPRLGSTIIDATAYSAGLGPIRVVRKGPISFSALIDVAGESAFVERG